MSQVDSAGIHFCLLKEICNHRLDQLAITKRFGFSVSKNGNKTPKMTTVRWNIQVEWKDRYMQWLDLKDMKASYQLEIGGYVVTNKINDIQNLTGRSRIN